MKIKRDEDISMYVTYSLLDKGTPDKVTHVVNPPLASIELAKEEVDANEK